MKKTLYTLLLLTMVQMTAFAIPAKPGVKKQIMLQDGRMVMAELRGDEKVSYWQTADGRNFVKGEAAYYEEADIEALRANAVSEQMTALKKSGMRKSTGVQPAEPISGEMKGLVILVQFDDLEFEADHDAAFYEQILNEPGFTNDEGYYGSVRDYFLEQSGGKLDYNFDVVGPITLPYDYAYYGQNTSSSTQKNMKAFITSALNAVKGKVDFSQYDNDDDEYVDQVFFLFAGNGEADTGDADRIWPHMFYASSYGISFIQNGVRVDAYACSCELQDTGLSGGIGAICHEFSHCLGLPDMYCTDGSGTYGNFYWDVLDVGCYLGDCFRPCGYNAYERAFCGWLPLEELTEAVEISHAPSLSEGGKAYAIYNDNNRDEYFILEPRNKTGWDAELPNSGLLIYHVDFDAFAWMNNTVNNVKNHQRCAVVPADNNSTRSIEKAKGDIFPYNTLNAFHDGTRPSSKLFNENVDGTLNLGKTVYDITRNDDGTVSFSFVPSTEIPDGIATVVANGNDTATFNIMGQRIMGNSRGLVISSGRKIVLR